MTTALAVIAPLCLYPGCTAPTVPGDALYCWRHAALFWGVARTYTPPASLLCPVCGTGLTTDAGGAWCPHRCRPIVSGISRPGIREALYDEHRGRYVEFKPIPAQKE